ncbi:MAG: ABC transporter permease subunit [Spirochaetaceae bacterium]|jgi:ABC-type Fe3+ transport system permease subunit|nr:ABC transporter permease subunit [Spirochaetaceae bacterium]
MVKASRGTSVYCGTSLRSNQYNAQNAVRRLILSAAALSPAVILVAAITTAAAGQALMAGKDGYAALLASPFFKKAVVFSFLVAVFCALISVFAGAFLAFLFCEKTGGVIFLANIYVALPYLAAASFVANTFGDNGLAAHLVKIIFPPLRGTGIRYNPIGVGVIIACIYKQIPFVFLTLSAFFRGLREKFYDTACTLGTRPITIFFKVYLPNAVRPLAGAAILIFQFTLFNYEAFAFLGPSSPKGLGELLIMFYYSADASPKKIAMALCALQIAFTIITAAALAVIIFGGRKKEF